MVRLNAGPVLLIASAIWIVWRVVTWHRGRSGTVARELAIATLFVWSLVIVRLTFFPLVIIFYDWHGASNLTPFASILQLLTDTPASVAFDNIVGNLVLFAPLGVLLPLLFHRLQQARQIFWRAAAVSTLIEATQFVTRARSVDVDDILLNTAGAVAGFAVYRTTTALARSSPTATRLFDRMASTNPTEPLLTAVIPITLTMLIALPIMVNQVVDATLSDTGIVSQATTGWADSTIGTRTNIGDHTYLVVTQLDHEGPLRLASFQRVLPGRYTWLGTGDEPAAGGSRYSTNISAFNPSEGEQPILAVWGYNADPAATLTVTGNGLNQTFTLQANDYFVVGAKFEYDPDSAVLPDFQLSFIDGNGADITRRFHRTDN
jgi:glycopeptide antibiotics resistance protein